MSPTIKHKETPACLLLSNTDTGMSPTIKRMLLDPCLSGCSLISEDEECHEEDYSFTTDTGSVRARGDRWVWAAGV